MHLVALTGAGISADSGLATFRDANGLWEGYDIRDVATPEAWSRDPELVLRFYNERRRAVLAAQPNAAHLALAALEDHLAVSIITQNVDDLHERAGSTRVLHLHGEIRKARSTFDPTIVLTMEGSELSIGDRCPRGSQLRPHIVWFGEDVPAMEDAITLVETADIFAVIGTSLVVYPAASLVDYAPEHAQLYIVDPRWEGGVTHQPLGAIGPGVRAIAKRASEGVPEMVKELIGAGAT